MNIPFETLLCSKFKGFENETCDFQGEPNRELMPFWIGNGII